MVKQTAGRNQLGDFAPKFAELNDDVLFGEVWSREDKEAIKLAPGDVVNIPVGVKHRHGAALDSWFSHLAIEVPGTETSNEWLEAVDDAHYEQLK